MEGIPKFIIFSPIFNMVGIHFFEDKVKKFIFSFLGVLEKFEG